MMTKSTLYLGADHAGFKLKEAIKQRLNQIGYQICDAGCFNGESVHYPDFGQIVAKAVANKEVERGILICGTGIGMSITANRYDGVRATLCHDMETSRLAREHNDSNILVLGAKILSDDLAFQMLDIWLKTKFEGGRHQERLNKIEKR